MLKLHWILFYEAISDDVISHTFAIGVLVGLFDIGL